MDSNGEEARTPAQGGGDIGEASHRREAISTSGRMWARSSAENLEAAFQRGQEQMSAVVSRYPFSSTMTSFTAGLAIGVAIGLLITEPPPRRWYERVPDAFGRRWLESLLNSLPESVRTQIS